MTVPESIRHCIVVITSGNGAAVKQRFCGFGNFR